MELTEKACKGIARWSGQRPTGTIHLSLEYYHSYRGVATLSRTCIVEDRAPYPQSINTAELVSKLLLEGLLQFQIERNHWGIESEVIQGARSTGYGKIECHERLGGIFKRCRRAS